MRNPKKPLFIALLCGFATLCFGQYEYHNQPLPNVDYSTIQSYKIAPCTIDSVLDYEDTTYYDSYGRIVKKHSHFYEYLLVSNIERNTFDSADNTVERYFKVIYSGTVNDPNYVLHVKYWINKKSQIVQSQNLIDSTNKETYSHSGKTSINRNYRNDEIISFTKVKKSKRITKIKRIQYADSKRQKFSIDKHTYDDKNQLVRVKRVVKKPRIKDRPDYDNFIISYKYDSLGSIVSQKRCVKGRSSCDSTSYDISYDDQGNWTTIVRYKYVTDYQSVASKCELKPTIYVVTREIKYANR